MDDTEQVYEFDFNYVKEQEALPSYTQVGEALGMTKYEVAQAVGYLRKLGRVEPTVLLPTAYAAWWRAHRRARDGSRSNLEAP